MFLSVLTQPIPRHSGQSCFTAGFLNPNANATRNNTPNATLKPHHHTVSVLVSVYTHVIVNVSNMNVAAFGR
jgi:hypothetical protein